MTRATATIPTATVVVRERIVPIGRADGSGAIGPQPVAGAAHGLEGPVAERAVDLAAKVTDVDLDDVAVAVEGEVPHVVEQRLLRDDVAFPAHQRLQEGELTTGELDVHAVAGAAVGADVEHEAAGLQHRRVVAMAAGQGP